ncbi:MAG TPA: alanine racemase, partial [Beijerinckiaceae bacterium]
MAQAALTVDLDALVANWRALARRVASAECAAVVKADAYGVGLEPAARALAQAGCRTLFVAHASEATRLREALGDAGVLRVYALNAFAWGEAGARAVRDAGARPVIGSPTQWATWRAVGGGAAALHVDTGMNRLGTGADEAAAIAADPAAGSIDLVMTHFVSSEIAD